MALKLKFISGNVELQPQLNEKLRIFYDLLIKNEYEII